MDWRQTQRDYTYGVHVFGYVCITWIYIFTSVGLTSTKMGSFCAWIVALLLCPDNDLTNYRAPKKLQDVMLLRVRLSRLPLEALQCVGGMLSGSGLYQLFLSTVLHGKGTILQLALNLFTRQPAEFWLNLSAPEVPDGSGVELGIYKAQLPASNPVPQQQPHVKKSRRGPRSRSIEGSPSTGELEDGNPISGSSIQIISNSHTLRNNMVLALYSIYGACMCVLCVYGALLRIDGTMLYINGAVVL
ncbi:choline/ethanolaminephosphotransferase 1 [Phtheirospermum japonicum]|uniref:Choline/ethanolaminephosphotransferase 1 n=1 Tax=Phtheirospermum japonicum TaxID=374723 RepID=A0A830C3S7_9LAMI|nr:choline/ethanolaminephosphotransferase 1 [Phtheirospermum japonicum]